MDTQQIPQADLLDILFDGRNKAYGAYDLRRNYNRRLYKALVVMGSMCLLLATSYVVAGKLSKAKAPQLIYGATVELSNAPEKKQPPIVLPKPVHVAMAPTVRDVIFRIVKDDQVKPEDVRPPENIPDDAKIGVTTTPGQGGDASVETPPSNGAVENGTIVAPPKKEEEADVIFTKVEIESSYKGGMAAWQRFLIRNFRPPEVVGGENTSVTVVVSFIVDKEGNVSDVQAISGPDQLRKEAVRVIKLSGQWEPAIQNGRKVSSYKKQPITVMLEGQ